MYRLLSLRKVSLQKVRIATVQPNAKQVTELCSFCRVQHPKVPKAIDCIVVRQQTTSTSTVLQDTPIKKKKRKSWKYAELLEVTNKSLTDTKAAVQKLNAAHLSRLVDQPGVALDQLHKIKNKKKGTSLKNVSTSVSTIQENREENRTEDNHLPIGYLEEPEFAENKNTGLSSSLGDHNKPAIDETKSKSSVDMSSSNKSKNNKINLKSKEKKMKREVLAAAKRTDLDRKGKERSLVRSLNAYLELSVNCGMVNQAHSTLMYYRHFGKRNENAPQVKEVLLFNILLHGLAGKGKLGKIKEVLTTMAEDSIEPVPQTYAAVFECVGRLKDSPDNKEMLESMVLGMTSRGISLSDLLNKSKFVSDQREMVLKGIKIIEPEFEAVYTRPDLSSDSKLLRAISDTEGAAVSPAHGLLTVSELQKRAEEQLKLETHGVVVVKSVEKKIEATPTILYYRKKLAETEASWRKIALEAFERDLNALRNQQYNKHLKSINLYPFLNVLDPEQYVDAIMRLVTQLAEGSETFSPSMAILSRELGRQIFHKYQVQIKGHNGVLNKMSEIYSQYCEWYINRPDGLNSRTAWQKLVHKSLHHGSSLDAEQAHWPAAAFVGIGKFLFNIILRDLKIDGNCIKPNSKTPRYLPAFYSLFRSQGRQMKEEIKPHPILARIYRDSQRETLTFDTALLPSLCPPQPWSTIHSGGYLVAKTDIIRLPQSAVQQWQMFEAVPQKQLYPALDSLNQLGSIPWRVNTQVLDVILEVFRDGGSTKLDVPEPPSSCLPLPPLGADATKKDKVRLAKEKMALKRKKSEMYSLWCDCLYRLSLANHFREEVFWLPHNMDFRGRVYPVPPHLNHLGSDLARSILVFASGKPLGPGGLDWLKIHCINLTGLKKRAPISERLAYANEILPKILDSAEKPLSGEMWWAESDEPWQTLAACMEIATALKSPNPAEYVSRFPIHQDGSCNGLQHYAALGRDEIGAASVNLSPSPQPQDVYSAVAALVEKSRKRDAEDDVKIAQVLEGFIQRKVIKQTVMTTVYGVTRFGARLQIAKQLKDIDDFPKEYVWQGSTYLVSKTFHSLREMFQSAREIQDWFTECARLVSQVCGQNMEWVTPLGLPIVQPYSRNNRVVDGKTLSSHVSMDMFEKPNTMKQKNAFPPNFIHSLDSSHMMLTSLHCEHEGITFISVHDCFWTHPCNVHQMNKICREQFVALHSEPILEDLSQYLIRIYGYNKSDITDDGSVLDMTKSRLNRTLSQLPKKGNFDLNSVLTSVYFFS